MNIPYLIALRISGQLAVICLSGIWLLTGLLSQAASTPPSAGSGKYQFDGTISRPVLENFLARSISVEGVFNGRGDGVYSFRVNKDGGFDLIQTVPVPDPTFLTVSKRRRTLYAGSHSVRFEGRQEGKKVIRIRPTRRFLRLARLAFHSSMKPAAGGELRTGV